MLTGVSAWVLVSFFLVVAVTIGLLAVVINGKRLVAVLVGWSILQSAISFSGLYAKETNTLPPRIVLFGILPTVILLVLLFILPSGKKLLDGVSLKHITLIHVIRLPIEIVLYGLYLNKAVPQLMTFEGGNLDILSGISAPIIVYFGFMKGKINRTGLLIWNFVCLGLLFNIVARALLSAPSPIQRFAFDQPNIAILHFPFSLLPTLLVPTVIFAHLAAIRLLLKRE